MSVAKELYYCVQEFLRALKVRNMPYIFQFHKDCVRHGFGSLFAQLRILIHRVQDLFGCERTTNEGSILLTDHKECGRIDPGQFVQYRLLIHRRGEIDRSAPERRGALTGKNPTFDSLTRAGYS